MERCPNCGSPLQGPFCFQCGQQDKDIRRFFLALLNEIFEDLFAPNGRTARTLLALLFLPGRLTVDYSAGRRARYLPPIRLYLITSFLFFLFLSLSSAFDSPIRIQNDLTVDVSEIAGDSDIVVLGDLPEGGAHPGPDTDAAAEGSPDVATGADDAVPEGEPPAAAEPEEDETFERDLQEATAEFDISLLSESANQSARDLIKNQARKVRNLAREDAAALVTMILDLIPPVMFILLPMFALLLKLTYIGSGRYYSEQLVLALHTHSFVFLILLLRRLIGYATPLPYLGVVAEWLVVAISIWTPLYLFLTLRTYFGEGTGVTILKCLLLTLLYAVMFMVILPFAMVWGFLTL